MRKILFVLITIASTPSASEEFKVLTKGPVVQGKIKKEYLQKVLECRQKISGRNGQSATVISMDMSGMKIPQVALSGHKAHMVKKGLDNQLCRQALLLSSGKGWIQFAIRAQLEKSSTFLFEEVVWRFQNGLQLRSTRSFPIHGQTN